MKILAILYPGGEVAKNNPGLLGCAENALGLRDFLEKKRVLLHIKNIDPAQSDIGLMDIFHAMLAHLFKSLVTGEVYNPCTLNTKSFCFSTICP